MVVCGPANHEKAGIAPLDGFIRTDWLPYPFTMNWRITEPGRTIRFEAGEPIARIFPYPLAVLDEFQVQVRELDDDPEFKQRFVDWAERRQENYAKRKEAEAELAQTNDMPDLDALWSKQYAQGKGAAAAGSEHQTVFRCKPVVKK